MKPERKLWHELKRNTPKITWTRIENTSLFGTPDLLGYNTFGHFFTVELKITSDNKIRFSPHQIAFHIKHPNNTFILAKKPSQGSCKLFPGTCILALDKEGFKNKDACCLSLEDLENFFESLGDGRLRLVT
jgi:Holliday junction resolvase